MNAKQLAHWILSQPENIQNSDVNTIVHGHPFGAKRAVAFSFKDKSGQGIYIESMGTHINDKYGKIMDFISVKD